MVFGSGVQRSICSGDNWKSLARPVRASISAVYDLQRYKV